MPVFVGGAQYRVSIDCDSSVITGQEPGGSGLHHDHLFVLLGEGLQDVFFLNLRV